MKNIYHSTFFKAAALAMMVVVMTACHQDPCKNVGQPLKQDKLSFGDQVRMYLERDQKGEGGGIAEGKYIAYFDLSDGMDKAYATDGIKSNLDRVTHTVTANNDVWEVYGLEAGEVKSMGNLSQTELFNRLLRTSNLGIMAPIEEALKQIVANKKPALLVTDFEEYDKDEGMGVNVIEEQAYAARYLQAWMGLGGAVKFYIMEYKENQLNKKLFFVVFDGKSRKLTDDIDFAMKSSAQGNYKEYELQATPYKVFTDYPVGKGGNFMRANGMDPIGLEYVALDDLNTEAYNAPLRSWLQIVEEMMSYRNEPSENYKGLLSKLYVNLSDTQSRNISKVVTKVTDITADFESYTNNQFVLNYITAPDKSEDGTVELDCEQAYFYDNYGELLPEWQYKPVAPRDVTKERFLEVNQDAFNRSRNSSPEKTEIVVDFGREYTDTTVFNNNGGVYELLKRDTEGKNGRVLRVDICIAESDVADYSPLENLFNFESNLTYKDGKSVKKTKGVNRCMSQSVIETLRKGDLDGRVIYTYIIKDNRDADY